MSVPSPSLRRWNALAAAIMLGLFAWLCAAVFWSLGADARWDKTWAYRQSLFNGWLTTLGVSLASLIGSTLIGLLFMFGQRAPLASVRRACRLFLEFVRETPLLVHLLFGYFVIFAPLMSRSLNDLGWNDKLVIGVILLSLFEGAYLGEILRGGIDSIPKTQWDAARAAGFNRGQIYRYVIFPQALRRVLPATAGLFVSLIKDSSLLSVIGVMDFTYNTRSFITSTYAGLEGYVPLAVGYLILTVPIAWFSHYLEKRFRHET